MKRPKGKRNGAGAWFYFLASGTVLLLTVLALLARGIGTEPEDAAAAATQTPAATARPTGEPSPEPTASPDASPEAELTPTAVPTPSPTAAPTPTPTAAPTDPGAEGQPQQLAEKLRMAGHTFASLDCSQLVLAAANGNHATVYCYERAEGETLWQAVSELSGLSANLGRNGTGETTQGNRTPTGLFGLGYAFGTTPREELSLSVTYREITEDSCWVTDADSAWFNQWAEEDTGEWNSCIRLAEDPAYTWGVLLEYNVGLAASASRGSAVFLQCGEEATDGSIALPQGDLERLIGWLDEEARPRILIVG